MRGFQTGGFPDLDLSFFVLLGTFPIFPWFSRFARVWSGDFPDSSLVSVSAYEEHLRGTVPKGSAAQSGPFPKKKWETPRSAGQRKCLEEAPRRTSRVPLASPYLCLFFIGLETKKRFRLPGVGGEHFHCTVDLPPGHIRCRQSPKNLLRLYFFNLWKLFWLLLRVVDTESSYRPRKQKSLIWLKRDEKETVSPFCKDTQKRPKSD